MVKGDKGIYERFSSFKIDFLVCNIYAQGGGCIIFFTLEFSCSVLHSRFMYLLLALLFVLCTFWDFLVDCMVGEPSKLSCWFVYVMGIDWLKFQSGSSQA